MSTAVIHRSPAYELSAETRRTPLGIELRFVSYVPTARRPERQAKLSIMLSPAELLLLKSLLEAELA